MPPRVCTAYPNADRALRHGYRHSSDLVQHVATASRCSKHSVKLFIFRLLHRKFECSACQNSMLCTYSGCVNSGQSVSIAKYNAHSCSVLQSVLKEQHRLTNNQDTLYARRNYRQCSSSTSRHAGSVCPVSTSRPEQSVPPQR